MPAAWLVGFWAVLGAAVGSFLNVVVDRLPVGDSIIAPPSHCEACSRRLRPLEMVPVLSYLLLRGRCRTCGASVGLRVLVVELGTGLLFALLAWRVSLLAPGGWVSLVLTSAYLAVLVVSTATDLEHGLILDKVMLPAVALGLVGSLTAGWPGLARYLGGGVLGAAVIAFIIWVVPGGMGWGDAKLAGFIGLVTGLPGMLFALFIAFVMGGVVAGVLMATGRRKRGETIPLGPFLALGGAATLLFGAELLEGFYTLAEVVG
jgi:leader peptidase (prepilin peptidase)/N-methyltransferase